MPSSREIEATNKFLHKVKLPHVKVAIGPGSTEGTPDRLILLPGGVPLFVEFKEGKLVDIPGHGPSITFSGKHGLKGSQINWFRGWLKVNGDAGLMVSTQEWTKTRYRKFRYFYRHNPPSYLLRRLKKSHAWLSEFTEIEPTAESFVGAVEKFYLDMRSRESDPIYQKFLIDAGLREEPGRIKDHGEQE